MAVRPSGQGPPGLAAPCGPPSEPPPPAPPGLFLGTARPGAGSSSCGVPAVPGIAEESSAGGLLRQAPGEPVGDKQAEISGLIAAQVTRLLEKARQSTESRVKQELKGIRDHMEGLNSQLDQMVAQLDGLEPQLGAEYVGQLLSNIEKQWGQEIRTLKEELHQTILAHNHNADLIKHHKDTIDALREKCHRLQGGGSGRTGGEIQQQLGRLSSLMRQQNAQPKMDPLFTRLQELERRVHETALTARAWHYPHPMMPPMPGIGMRPPMPGIPPATMGNLGAGNLVGGHAAGGMLSGEADASVLGVSIEVEKGDASAGLVAEATGAAATA